MGIRPITLSANAYDDYAYSLERSDHIWDFFQHREPAEDFRGFREDLACREDLEDLEDLGFQVEVPADFRGLRDLREADREAFRRRRPLRRNSCRKCRLPHSPSTPGESDDACSATHTSG